MGVQSNTDKNPLRYPVGSTAWLRKRSPSPQYQQPFLPQVLPGGWGVDACEGQAFPLGAEPVPPWPACSPEAGSKAMAHGARQFIMAGPHVGLHTQQLLQG